MTYRIIFKPRLGGWVVQLQLLPFIWISVHDGEKKLQLFKDFQEASKYVEERGIQMVYRDYRTKPGWFDIHPEAQQPPVSPNTVEKLITAITAAVEQRQITQQ